MDVIERLTVLKGQVDLLQRTAIIPMGLEYAIDALIEELTPAPWIDWPTEPGEYWFYGWPSEFSQRNYDQEWIHVTCRQGANALIVTGKSMFLFKSETKGVFQRIRFPEPPTVPTSE